MAQEHDSTFSTHHLAAETTKPLTAVLKKPASCSNHASSTSQTRPQQSSEPVTKRVLSGLKDAVVTLAGHQLSKLSRAAWSIYCICIYIVYIYMIYVCIYAGGLSLAQDLNVQSCAPTPQSPRAKPQQWGLRKQSLPESCESWAMVSHSGTWGHVLSYDLSLFAVGFSSGLMLDCPMPSSHEHATVHVILGNLRSSNALGLPNERAVSGESAREDLPLMRQLLVWLEFWTPKSQYFH